MAWKDAHIPVLSGNLGFLGGVFHHQAFRRNDFEFECVCHRRSAFGYRLSALPAREVSRADTETDTVLYAVTAFIFSAFSSTSSIVPTM